MKELEEAISKVFNDMVSSGALTKIIEGHVQKAVDSVLGNCFSYNSQFNRTLSAEINKNLRIDCQGLGLAGYNATLLQIVKTKLDASFYKFAEKQISEEMDTLLALPPSEIKLSELVKTFREMVCREEESEGFSLHVERNKHLAGYTWVHLDPKEGKDVYQCDYAIGVDKEGRVYSLSIPHCGDVTKKIFAGKFYGFDKMLFQLYAAKTKLILDEDSI